jgi:hypothetical protein
LVEPVHLLAFPYEVETVTGDQSDIYRVARKKVGFAGRAGEQLLLLLDLFLQFPQSDRLSAPDGSLRQEAIKDDR